MEYTFFYYIIEDTQERYELTRSIVQHIADTGFFKKLEENRVQLYVQVDAEAAEEVRQAITQHGGKITRQYNETIN